MAQHKHFTFRSGREVLDQSIQYLSGICEVLESLKDRDHGERVDMLLNSVAAEQRNLLGSIERLQEHASEKVVETFTQYTVEMPTEPGEPDEPLTTLGLIQWLTGLNRHLQELFHELSEHHDSDEATEAFAGIAQQIESHDMRLSKEYQRTEDL